MSRFDDFARQLSSEHAAKTADHKALQDREQAERHATWQAAIALIEEVAIPVLEDAQRACEARGLRPVIERNWEKGLYMDPSVTFQIFGPKKRKFEESSYEIEANRAVIRIEDQKIKSSIVKRSSNSKTGVDFVGYGEEGLSDAVKYVMVSYYEEIDPRNL